MTSFSPSSMVTFPDAFVVAICQKSALHHQNLPLFAPPSPQSPFLPLILQLGLKRICDPWPNKRSGAILSDKRKRVVRQAKGYLSDTLSGCLTDRRNTWRKD